VFQPLFLKHAHNKIPFPLYTDPQDAQVAKMYLENKPEFDRTAKYWVEQYATPSNKDEAVDRVCEMGFDKESARRALEQHEWDEQAAVNDLLGM
jgi:ubiquitin-conjugating enzyme (huntingtin interacting protein 2)